MINSVAFIKSSNGEKHKMPFVDPSFTLLFSSFSIKIHSKHIITKAETFPIAIHNMTSHTGGRASG